MTHAPTPPSRSAPKIARILWALAILGSIALLPRVRVENPPELWNIEPPLPEQRLWRFAKEQFGRRDLLLVGVRRDGCPDRDFFGAAESLEVWLARQPEVAGVFGIREARQIMRRLPAFDVGSGTAQSLRRAVLSDDRAVTLLYVTLQPTAGPRAFQAKASLVAHVKREAAARLPPGTGLVLAGQPAVNASLQELIRRDAVTAVPLALGAMILVLGFTTGLASLGPLAAVSASLLVLLGGMGAAGIALSAATIVALPVTAVVGLSYNAYVLKALDRSSDRRAVAREIRAPLLWVYGTTMVSVLSFVFVPIQALRLFAVITAAGVSLAAISAVTLLPDLHRRRTRVRARGIAVDRWGYKLYGWSARRPAWTAACWILALLAGAAGLTRLRFEPNNFLSFFPRGHEVVAAHEELDRAFGGSVPVEVLAHARDPDAERDPLVRARLSAFVDGARRIHRIGPALLPSASTADGLGPAAGNRFVPWFRARDSHYTRAIFSVPVLPTQRARVLFRSLDSLAAALSDPELRIQVTGLLPSSIALLHVLVSIQAWDIGSLALLMLLAFAVVARGLRAGALLLIPNLVPLLAVVGSMGLLGVALDFTTITILSMLLGIAVDNSIHLRWAVRDQGDGSGPSAVPRAVRRIAAPATLTAITAVAGFCVLVASPFPASQRVGLFMAIGLAVAWLADMTLAPMLVNLERSYRSLRKTRREATRVAGKSAGDAARIIR